MACVPLAHIEVTPPPPHPEVNHRPAAGKAVPVVALGTDKLHPRHARLDPLRKWPYGLFHWGGNDFPDRLRGREKPEMVADGLPPGAGRRGLPLPSIAYRP